MRKSLTLLSLAIVLTSAQAFAERAPQSPLQAATQGWLMAANDSDDARADAAGTTGSDNGRGADNRQDNDAKPDNGNSQGNDPSPDNAKGQSSGPGNGQGNDHASPS